MGSIKSMSAPNVSISQTSLSSPTTTSIKVKRRLNNLLLSSLSSDCPQTFTSRQSSFMLGAQRLLGTYTRSLVSFHQPSSSGDSECTLVRLCVLLSGKCFFHFDPPSGLLARARDPPRSPTTV